MITRLNIELEPELSMANACLVLHYLMNVYTTFDFLDDGNGSMLISASCEHCGSPYCGGSHIYINKELHMQVAIGPTLLDYVAPVKLKMMHIGMICGRMLKVINHDYINKI